jgi:ribosomal protein L24
VGQAVMVVRGKAAGCEGELVAIHEADYNCDVRVTQRDSAYSGELLRGLEYDYVCKYSP